MIDETDLMNLLYALDDARHDLFYAIKKVSELSTVEAIPKADYENRLKADLMAVLTELQLEFEENTVRWYVWRVDGKSDDVVLMETINDIIQQKINALKAESELQERSVKEF